MVKNTEKSGGNLKKITPENVEHWVEFQERMIGEWSNVFSIGVIKTLVSATSLEWQLLICHRHPTIISQD